MAEARDEPVSQDVYTMFPRLCCVYVGNILCSQCQLADQNAKAAAKGLETCVICPPLRIGCKNGGA